MKGEGDRSARPPPPERLPVVAGGVINSRRETEDSRQRPVGRVLFSGVLKDQLGYAAALFIKAAKAAHARSKADLVACINEPAAAAAALDAPKQKRIARCPTAIAVRGLDGPAWCGKGRYTSTHVGRGEQLMRC